MSALHFEWDPTKAAANQRKHGVSFQEAESAFSDENGLLLDDTITRTLSPASSSSD